MQLFSSEADLPKLVARKSALCWTFQQLAGTFLGTTIVGTSVILWDQMLPEVTVPGRLDSHLATLCVVGWDLDSCLHASFRPTSYPCCLAIKDAPAIPYAAGCKSGMFLTACTDSCAKFFAGSWNPSRAYDAPQNVRNTRMLNAERAMYNRHSFGGVLVSCSSMGCPCELFWI
ncbi:hypothetical protein E4T44_09046 [Aureobasidium sp. EXF-8845]|nr:hypothetical protein E4T44_09046 [Aureobasidium sp. EXF-8845]